MKLKKIIFILSILIFIFILGHYLLNKFFYTGELIGIRGTGVYHRSNCHFVNNSPTDKLIFYDNLYETAQFEFRPCKECHPPENSKEIKQYLKQKALEEEEKEKSSQNNSSYLWTPKDVENYRESDSK